VAPPRFPHFLEKFFAALGLLSLAYAGGCHAVPQPASQTKPATVSLRAHAQVQPPPPRKPYRLFAYTPYIAEDVASLEVILWDEASSDELPLQTLIDVDPTGPIFITHLKRQRPYWVRLKAFDAGENRIDSQDEACVTAFETGDADFEASLAFNCRLANRTFPGFASGTINISGAAEAIATVSLELRANATELDRLELGAADLDKVITLSNLKRDVLYDVRLSAVNAEEALISDCDEAEADCRVTFTVDPDGPTPPLTFPLKLVP
jgi:hypothetical protein